MRAQPQLSGIILASSRERLQERVRCGALTVTPPRWKVIVDDRPASCLLTRSISPFTCMAIETESQALACSFKRNCSRGSGMGLPQRLRRLLLLGNHTRHRHLHMPSFRTACITQAAPATGNCEELLEYANAWLSNELVDMWLQAERSTMLNGQTAGQRMPTTCGAR